VREAIDYYRAVHAIIRDGQSRRFGPQQKSFRHPKGWQAVTRATKSEVLVVAHSFSSPLEQQVTVPLPSGSWHIKDYFGDGGYRIRAGKLEIAFSGPLTGQVLRLEAGGI